MNVLFELETDGDEFIWIHELKLSDETWNVPEQDVFDEFVVTNVVSIVSENVTVIEELTETEVSEFVGVEDETVGEVVSDWSPVLNPSNVVLWLSIGFPEVSFTPVVTRIIKTVEIDRLGVGVTVNVWLLLDVEGVEDIWRQELKLSDETWIVPVQELFEVFVVIEEVSIDSENVTEIDVLVETEVSPLDGEVEETVGGVVSVEVLSVEVEVVEVVGS